MPEEGPRLGLPVCDWADLKRRSGETAAQWPGGFGPPSSRAACLTHQVGMPCADEWRQPLRKELPCPAIL